MKNKFFLLEIFVIALQLMHKKRGHQTSAYLFTFWLIFLFCAIPQLRWEVNNFNIDFNDRLWPSYHAISFISFFSLISLMTVLNTFSDKQPRHSTYPKYANPSPELSAGALNKLFFEWFSSTTWLGFKRPLTEDDVYDINPEFASNELTPKFDKHFRESIERNHRFEMKVKFF